MNYSFLIWDLLLWIPYIIPILCFLKKFNRKIIFLLLLAISINMLVIPNIFISNTLDVLIKYLFCMFIFLNNEKNIIESVSLSSLILFTQFLVKETMNFLFSNLFLIDQLPTQIFFEAVLLIIYSVIFRKIANKLLQSNKGGTFLLILGNFFFFWEISNFHLVELEYIYDSNFFILLLRDVFFCFLLLFTIAIIIAQQATDTKVRNEREKVFYESSKKYMQDLEQQATEIRKFKHDYQNILLTMDSFFNEKAYLELEEYYLTQIRPTSVRIENMNLQLSELKKIQNLPLKSLLYTKLSALNDGIALSLEIQEHPSLSEKQLIPFLRTTGILLDNAIEALNELEGGQLNIGLLYQDELMIIIENTCSPDLPAIHQLTTENFSTKGEKRGLGLTNAQQLSSEHGFLLTLTHKDSLFTQILEIGELL
jgi:two-component system sensor histidine kinase AgrC